MDLNGRVAVVTGGGSGMGRATAVALAREGATVAVCDIRAEAAQATLDQLVSAGGSGSAHHVDVSSVQAMQDFVDAVLTKHRVVDVVVNNAGIAHLPTPSTELRLDNFHKVVDVNFWGVVHGSLFFLPHLLGRPRSSLVNVASNAAVLGVSGYAPYTASKYAVRGFTESLRTEVSTTNLRVTLVCPGSTKTQLRMNSPLIDEHLRAAVQRDVEQAWGVPPEHVASAITRAIRRGTPRVLVGRDTKSFDAIGRVFPGRYSTFLGSSIGDRFLAKLYAPRRPRDARRSA